MTDDPKNGACVYCRSIAASCCTPHTRLATYSCMHALLAVNMLLSLPSFPPGHSGRSMKYERECESTPFLFASMVASS